MPALSDCALIVRDLERNTHETFAAVTSLLKASFQTSDDAILGQPYFQRATRRTLLIEDADSIWEPISNSDD